MAKLTRAEREGVRNKYDGLCAYCGCDLPKVWHADHLEPIIRLDWIGLPTGRPENDRLDNMMPACPPCNISKGSMALEVWRGWLAGHITSLNRHHPIYRIAKSFGLVTETGAPVVFHFEQAAAGRVSRTDLLSK